MQFSPYFVLGIFLVYFLFLFCIAWLTSRKIDQTSFFNGNRKSPWYIISIGMIGTSISGVTFVSVPGMVAGSHFAYLQMVMGFVIGYLVVALVLLPLYYRLNLHSIYGYLQTRYGRCAYKTGSSFFMVSRTLGSAIRLMVVALVLQQLVFSPLHIPFWMATVVTITLIYLYSFKGGVKTIIWTDFFQTLILISAILLSLFYVCDRMDLSIFKAIKYVAQSDYSNVFDWDYNSPRFFWKQFFAGIFTVVTMTGLDQDMMQKNLSCKTLKEAQKNMYWHGTAYLPINLLFLSLGALLYLYAGQINLDLPMHPDKVYAFMATNGSLPAVVGVLFILGIVAAAYSSADSALTALTTSFTLDILGMKTQDPNINRVRKWVHLGIALVFIGLIIFFEKIQSGSVIDVVYQVASYTYGPLLGMYAFGLMTKRTVRDRWIPLICILAPLSCFLLNMYSEELFSGYKFGFELLILNGFTTASGLWIASIGVTKKTII